MFWVLIACPLLFIYLFFPLQLSEEILQDWKVSQILEDKRNGPVVGLYLVNPLP